MVPPRKRTELLLAAAALLVSAVLLLAAGAKSVLAARQPAQTQPGAETAQQAGINPFEAAQTGTAPPGGSNPEDGSYVVGYTGVVLYPSGEAPLRPGGSEPAREIQPPAPQPLYPVNLNTATQAQLETLPGIGAVKAQAILAWRAANGGFANANQLLQVDGIGQKTLEGLLPYITW